MGERIVLLHGFAATHRYWDPVRRCLRAAGRPSLAPDLPGHGLQAGHERPLTFAACAEHVLSRAPARFALCGYSMGGRVALHVALAAPERVRRLVLVSTTAGIEDTAERELRLSEDRRLAEELREAPLERFIERWRQQPLFAGEPPETGALAAEDQRRNRPDALADALLGIGTGAMEPLWPRLGELAMPATVLVGERDRKFTVIGRRLAAALPDARLLVLPGGHSLALESPAAVAQVLVHVLEGLDAQTGAGGHLDPAPARGQRIG